MREQDSCWGDFRLVPQLTFLVLSSMPSSDLVAHNAVDSLTPLRQGFANIRRCGKGNDTFALNG